MARETKRGGDLMTALARAFRETHWQPRVDVYQTSNGWLLKYELAGVPLADVELAIRGRTVTLSGDRRDIRVDECRQSFCMEISYNRFERSLELPCELDQMAVASEYRDGMLIVRLTCEGTQP
jgi:HSP20 family protein